MGDHYSIFTLLDNSDESASAKIYNGAVTAVSIAGFLTEFGQMKATIDTITRGTMQKEQWVGDNTLLSNVRPVDQNAQREIKWKVNYIDTVTQKKYHVTLPTADPTGRMIAGTDLADMANADIAAFVTRFNSFARCPDNDTNAVSVVSIQLVGRNT